MKKIYQLENLDCANCAAKMEAVIIKIPGVRDVSISFMAQKMTLEVDDADFAEVWSEIKKAVAQIEPDCDIID